MIVNSNRVWFNTQRGICTNYTAFRKAGTALPCKLQGHTKTKQPSFYSKTSTQLYMLSNESVILYKDTN